MKSSSLLQIEKWVAAKSRIRAAVIADGLAANAEGLLRLNEEGNRLFLADDLGRVIWALQLERMVPVEQVEPLLDFPEEIKWSVDFFVALGFKTPFGFIDLFEIGNEGVDTESAPR
ncbi:MAG TPA: hypothetical protein VFO40_01675 [Chthoniobacterales bacterium]|nr:hypothetical protein [Chthoniobacterales bacterium]